MLHWREVIVVVFTETYLKMTLYVSIPTLQCVICLKDVHNAK